jgi:hypothetical protein
MHVGAAHIAPLELQGDPGDDGSDSPVEVKAGVRAGLNFATFGGEEANVIQDALRSVPGASAVNEGRRVGLVAGGFIVADFGIPVLLQTGLRYAQKGFQAATRARLGDGESVPVTTTIRTDYVEFPILARVEIPMLGPVSPHVLAGPAIGTNVNSAIKVEVRGESQTEARGLLQNTVSLELGGGVEFETPTGTATVDARFGFGLSRVFTNSLSIKHRGAAVAVGFVF